MKEFFIEISHPNFETIKSEMFEGNNDQFEKLKDDILKNGLGKLDFYLDNGDFIIISEKLVQESLVYIKIKK